MQIGLDRLGLEATRHSVRGDRAFLHNQSKRPLSLLHARLGLRHCLGNIRFAARKRQTRYFQGLEQTVQNPSHLFMLGFVLYFGLAAPCNDQQRRDTKRVVERGERVHHVTEAGVLAHGHRFPPGQKRSEGNPNCLAFARGADVIQRGITAHVVDQRGQKGTRHPGIL